jgi:acetylornithine deacetylase/succinyl-diaminopimelate desuccinylase-like protein
MSHTWQVVLDETVTHLRHLIQIDTTNPPGNELPLARYLATQCEAVGLETHLFEPTTNRAALVARLRGSGDARPILLLAHMDVVGVEREHWSVDPFAAEVRDGYLYGRGAIDDKGMLAANLQVLLLLARAVNAGAAPPRRDIVLVATSDEEGGGEWGIDWLAAHQPALLDAEYALNEGGRTRVVDGVPLYVAVQVAEKVSHVLRVVAHGPSGHASVPLPGNAIGALARAVVRIADYREPVHLLPATREFFRGLAGVWPHAGEAAAMREIAASADDASAARAAALLGRTPIFDAVLRTGISPTVIAGGIRHNVIPAEADATLSVRTLPGVSPDDVAARLRSLVGDPCVDVSVTDRGVDAPPSDHNSPMFAALRRSVAALDPAMVTLPYLSTGATDSAVLRAMGVQCYGVLPFPLEQHDEERMHGHDERIPLRSLLFGVRLLLRTVADITDSAPFEDVPRHT